jgi:hypothetical protein
MLSDRSAMDQFPENALAVLRTVGFENWEVGEGG